jgi:hypothetical protein
MTITDEKIINLSKKKTLLLIFGSCIFVILGFWMAHMSAAEIETQRRFNSPLLVHSIGVTSIIFFGLCGVVASKKLFDTKPGLILSPSGIFDNSSGASAGQIPWSDIVGFSIYEVHKQKMLIVRVSSPEKYIDKCNFFVRILLKASSSMSGSPIAITSSSLKISFKELVEICDEYYQKYGKIA